jgi:hypothetical protein
MTPADRDLLGRYLADHGWEPDGHGGWYSPRWYSPQRYSPQRAWHVDVDIASREHLVLSRRGGWSMTLRADDVEQAVALLRAYRVPALPPQRCARCGGAERDSWPGRLVAGEAYYDRDDDTDTQLPPDVDGYPIGRWAK